MKPNTVIRFFDDIIGLKNVKDDKIRNNLLLTNKLHAVGICNLLMMGFNSLFVFVYLSIGQVVSADVHFISFFLCGFNLLLLKKTEKIIMSAHILCLIFLALVFIVCAQTGGFRSPVIMWFFLLPVGAGFTINFRASFLYGLTITLAMLTLFKLQESSLIIPFDVHDPFFKEFYVFQLVSLLTAIVLLSYGFLKSHEKALKSISRSEAKFRELSEKAEQASRYKGEFLANMSHEVRTPLNGILGMMHLISDTDLTPEQKQHFEVVYSSANSLLTIINDVLDFSKVEAGKLEFDHIDFKLPVALKDMNTMFQMQAEQKNIDYRCTIDRNVPEKICGDPGRLRQVLMNLIGNAIKFTTAGQVLVNIRQVSESDDSVNIHFSVEDTGIGISESDRKKIFDPFSQADVSTTRKFGGTGLGLSICRELVKKMNGDIGVESEELLGSTFWFTLCFEKSTSKNEEVVFLKDIHERKLLICGGSDSSQAHLRDQLESLKTFAVISAGYQQILSELITAKQNGQSYDAIIIDMQIGRENALNLGNQLSDDPQFKKTPGILITSFGEKGDAARFSNAGYSAYLCKPIDLRLLDCCLKAVLHETETAKPRSIITKHSIAESRNLSHKILLADDNETNVIVATELLKRLGYQADIVRNGEDAVSAFVKKKYDLIIMDCQMPVLDGFEATEAIRKTEAGDQHIPIIAMTANALKGTREKCLEAGMDDYLTKPLDLLQLDKVMFHNLSGDKASAKTEGFEPIASGSDVMKIFDKKKLLNRFEENADIVDEIVSSFIKESPEIIEKIKAAVNKRNFEEIKNLSHAFKGASANVHADLLSCAVISLEDAAEEKNYNRIITDLSRIESEYEKFKGELG